MRSLRYLTNVKHALIWLVVTGLLVALLMSASLPALAYLGVGLVFFLPLVLVLCAVGGILPAILGMMLLAFGAVRVYGPGGLWLLVYLAPSAICFLFCLEKRLPFLKAAGYIVVSQVLSTLLLFIIFQAQAGGDLFSKLSTAAVEGIKALPGRDGFLYALWKNGLISHGLGEGFQVFEELPGGSLAFVPQVLEQFYKLIDSRLSILLAVMLPGFLTSYPILVGFLGTGLALKMGKTWQTADDLGMQPFSLWHVSRRQGRPLMLLALGYLVAMMTTNQVLQTAGQLMYNVFFSIFLIQGLSFFNFLLKRRGFRKASRLILILLLLMILSPAALFMGIYDQLADPRKLRTATAQ